MTELEISLAEREEEKGNLQLRILELEETISSEVQAKGRFYVADSKLNLKLRPCHVFHKINF